MSDAGGVFSGFGVRSMKTFVLDDSPFLRDRLGGFLTAVPGVELVGSADCSLFSLALLRALRPKLIIIHLSEPARRAVLILDRLAGFAPRPTVVLLVEDAAADDLRHYHRLGADQAFAISSGFEAFLARIDQLTRQFDEEHAAASV